jgi:hypothetical protein
MSVLLEPAKVMLTQIGQFLVSILLVIIILIVGWVICKLIKSLVTNILRRVKLDDVSDRIELDSILAKGGVKYSLSELIGVICYWLGILVTFVVALSTVGLITPGLVDKIISYIPNIIASIFILIVGMFVASLLKSIVQASVNNAGISHAAFLSRLTEIIVIVFAVLMVLEQLSIGVRISTITVAIFLGSLGLALALAFGLGCRDIAARFVSDLIERVNKK